MSRSSTLEASLEYAARGWPVLPVHTVTEGRCSCGRQDCPAPGKHPRTSHGVKDATVDEATIRGLWDLFPDSNAGIATGVRSGLVVLERRF